MGIGVVDLNKRGGLFVVFRRVADLADLLPRLDLCLRFPGKHLLAIEEEGGKVLIVRDRFLNQRKM